jgi:hypothetical protein
MPPPAHSGYINPGELYLQWHPAPQELADMLHYAQWLHEQAGISYGARLDLRSIYRRFRFPLPQRAPLPGQQGLLLNSDIGLILINQNDPAMRQRFTEAHELIEFLVEAAKKDERWRLNSVLARKPELKERWCDEAAGELLMPFAQLKPRVLKMGVSFATARQWAEYFQVSLTASLWQMIKASDRTHAIVRWRLKHKPKQLDVVHNVGFQLPLFGDSTDFVPLKRLRVEWAVANSQSIFVPSDKHIDEDSQVYAAWRDGIFTAGRDVLRLGSRDVWFTGENQPFEFGEERQVLSLLTIDP